MPETGWRFADITANETHDSGYVEGNAVSTLKYLFLASFHGFFADRSAATREPVTLVVEVPPASVVLQCCTLITDIRLIQDV